MNDKWHILTADTEYTQLRDLLERAMIVKTTEITVDYDLLKCKGIIHEH